jgi:flagellar biogenesis protein FliO
VTYFISAKASGQSRGRLRNKNISIIDRFSISRDKSFCIVEIAGKVYVIGVTNQSMTLIDTLDAGAFASSSPAETEGKYGGIAARRPGMAGGRLQNRIIEWLASLLTGKGIVKRKDGGAGAFAESLESARKKSGVEAEQRQPDDPEVKE